MWLFEIIGIVFTLGFFFFLFMLFGMIQVIQAIFAIFVFILLLPFVAVGTFLNYLLRQQK